jgi:hypothetical protein
LRVSFLTTSLDSNMLSLSAQLSTGRELGTTPTKERKGWLPACISLVCLKAAEEEEGGGGARGPRHGPAPGGEVGGSGRGVEQEKGPGEVGAEEGRREETEVGEGAREEGPGACGGRPWEASAGCSGAEERAGRRLIQETLVGEESAADPEFFSLLSRLIRGGGRWGEG